MGKTSRKSGKGGSNKKPGLSHENSTVQSSTSGSNQNAEPVVGNANTNNTEFVNHGLILWTEIRQQWVGNRSQNKAKQFADPVLRPETSSESLLHTNRPSSRPIPLPEMIEYLVNVWEEEGLYGEANLG